MKVYMIRHGQSEANIKRVYGGQSQIPLTAAGEEEAIRAGKRLEGITFDKVYTSDLIRAIRTQELCYPTEEAERLELIREMDVGELAGKPFDRCAEIYGEKFEADRVRANFAPYGGEDRAMVYRRAKEFMKLLEADPHDKVAVFSHNGFICAFCRAVMGVGPEDVTLFTNNCAVSTFVYANGIWKVETWNYNGEL
ncbi:MAG: histidine phosphatase family protein [Clostridia bacterium]|nr:histidine phosphatase family protein [Clostridia bacterium]